MAKKNLLLAANYKSDVGYAWWLMENFWKILSEVALSRNVRTYLTFPEINSISETITSSPTTVLEVNFDPNDESFVNLQLEFIRKNRIGAIYFTDQSFWNRTYYRYRRAGVKTIVNHDHTPGDRPEIGGLRGIVKSLYNQIPWYTVDRWIAISPFMKQRALTNGRIPKRKCELVQNGIEPFADLSARAKIRDSLSIDSGTIAIVSVGRANKYKGIERIIDIISQCISKTGKRFVYFHIGDGPHLKDFRDLAKTKGLSEDRCRFLGEIPSASKLLPGFDIAIHASEGEGFSLSILEFMSAGLAVVVSDNPSVSQAVENNYNGLLFSRDNKEMAADLLIKLIGDRKLRKTLGKNAQKNVVEKYSLSKMNQSFYPIANWIVERNL